MSLTLKQRRWDKVLLITPLFGFIIFGAVLLNIAGTVIFVKRIGANYIPHMYLVNAVFATLTSILIASCINRKSTTTLIMLTSITGALGFTGTFFLIQEKIFWGYPLILILTQVVYLLLGSIMMWDISLKICTPIEGKWAFGYFSIGASIGGVCAGLLSSLISNRYGPQYLIPIAVASLIVVFFNSLLLQKKYRDNLMPNKDAEGTRYLDSLKTGFQLYRKSRIAKMLSIILILFFIVRYIGDYEFNKILGATFSEKDFSKISGFTSIIENLGLLFISLLIQNWILNKSGVLNTFLFSPVIVLMPLMMLFFYPFYIIAIALKATVRIINFSTFSNSARLTFTAIPDKIRSSVTTFISGYSDSGGMLFAGLGLILLTKIFSNKWIIAIGIMLVLLTIFTIILLKKEYTKQVVKNLESNNIKDIHTSIENLAEPAYRKVGVEELMKVIQKKELDPETIRKIVFALGKIDNVNVIPSLLEIFKRHDITIKYAVVEAIHQFSRLNERLKFLPFTSFNLSETYQNIFMQEEDPELKIFILEHIRDFNPIYFTTFLKDAINNENPQIQYQAIKALKYFHDRGIIRYINPFLNSEYTMVKASGIIALWQFAEMRPDLIKKFLDIMVKKDKDSVLSAFLIISKLNLFWENRFVEKHLISDDPEIKTMAALTLLETGDSKGMDIIINNLIEKTPFSIVIARNIKNIPLKMKNTILKSIQHKDDKSIQTFVETLKGTYLNFSKEIETLIVENPNLISR